MGCCRLSHILIIVFNSFVLLFALLLLIPSSFSLHHSHDSQTKCSNFLTVPIFVIGLFLLIVSLLGCIGSCCRVTAFLWLYSAVMFLLILGLIIFSIFAVVVTNRGVGHAVAGAGYKEYKLEDYSQWLQKNIVSGKNWDKIRTCLSDTGVCQDLARQNQDASQLNLQTNMVPLQFGCCRPPIFCGFTFINATTWEVPDTGPASPDSDCTTWSNDQKILCLDCNSCKAGILENLKKNWWALTKSNLTVLLCLIVVYSISCCAYRSNRSDRYQRY